MNVRCYDLSQADEWNQIIRQMPCADVYYLADYLRIYEYNGDGKAILFVYEDDDGMICYPYLMRTITELPWLQAQGWDNPLYDISTAYGYGGPLCNATEPQKRARLFQAFDQEFERCCREQHIITEFVRFHPLLEGWNDYTSVSPQWIRNTICMDLTQPEEERIAAYTKGNRNRIRHALRKGFTVTTAGEEGLEKFISLYKATMDKKQALSYYYFNDDFFYNTVRYLQGNYTLMEVRDEEGVVASSLFLYKGDYAHYHLMGSDRDKLRDSPVNLLIHEAAAWAAAQGCKKLHLGGGYTGNDGLFRFKQNFNARSSTDFYIGRRIINHEIYDALLRMLPSSVPEDYFPAYRHPSLKSMLPSYSIRSIG
ncbi:GNAT family N-acetyltransferase [Paenibacillus alvei]|uniref:lipid II:glycine glycyltransferase FemX n=1 Tax=Paenibacillus TaxID=44249 RepID=UPI000287EC5D|nr:MULTISPECIES: GNAT family N-acetyltransferase [Paenibacillus]EJW19081.1 hypothetical protein PAV_1c00520 [Paenibacillus alvei DSM 29]MCY9542252.1 GNAT family N-acetyltransferase [Paenibacillus alvei]MCY9707311.1 GNAT family N-acetyltransferase [Paenibacillus alvei]MCY9736224.1 GNAT family N-acetyltransferase [Paenibacillus alvei]MCY9758266.1 GNAT family N-acetyltransferase [Paenibacillus alvei]